MTARRATLDAMARRSRPAARELHVAQHEAAHVVVGVALGLRLREAVVGSDPDEPGWLGYTWFPRGPKAAWALSLAAGIAWERALGDDTDGTANDYAMLRKLGYRGRGAEALVRAAGAMLAGLGPAHARVTRALLERDITHADVLAIAQGERVDAED